MWRTKKFWNGYRIYFCICYLLHWVLLFWLLGYTMRPASEAGKTSLIEYIPVYLFKFIVYVPAGVFVSFDDLQQSSYPNLVMLLVIMINCFIVFSVLFYLFRLYKRSKESKLQ